MAISLMLKGHLSDRGITQDQLAKALFVSRLTVSQLCNDKRKVTAEMALRLSKVFQNTTAWDWLWEQAEVDLLEARRRIGRDLAKIKPLKRR